MARRRSIALALPVLAAALWAPAADAARTRTVTLEDIAFKPGTLRASRGDSVRWIWRDRATPHNVRSRGSRRFKGSSTKTDGTHTVRFSRAGTYRYVCTIHLGMDGRIVVR